MLTWIKERWKAIAASFGAALALLGIVSAMKKSAPSAGTKQAQEVLSEVEADIAVQQFTEEIQRINQERNTKVEKVSPTEIDFENLVADLHRFQEAPS